jgi:hypothetical protein
MCPSGVTCLPTHLFSLLDTNNFISRGERTWDFLCLSVENPFFFTHQVDQKYFVCIHEVKKYMHTRPKKIIVCFFCIGYISGHADVPRLCLLRKTNKIARIDTKF